MVPTLGLSICICLASEHYGFRNHVWDIAYTRLIDTRKITFSLELLYLCASVIIKISILLFYRRLAKGILPKAFIYATWAIAAFIIAYFIAALITLFFTCRPFNGFWWRIDPFWRLAHPDACIDEGLAIVIVGSISALHDFLIALLPTVVFARLPMPTRQKIALGAVFGFSFLICLAGVLRIVYVKRVFFDTYDATWALYKVWIWTVVEIMLGPIVASAPALRVLLCHYIQPYFSYGYSYSISHEMTTHATDASHSRIRDSLREGAQIIPDEEDFPPSQPATASSDRVHPDDVWIHTMPDSGIPSRKL